MVTGIEEFVATAAIKAGISILAKPVATATFSGLKSIATSVIEVFGYRLTEYVLQQYQRHSCISTIVFQHQKSLNDLYIPLTLMSTAETINQKKSSGVKIDQFPTELIPKSSKILITDTAGMGKSTLSKFLFLQCLDSNKTIPFFIELRHLSDKLGPLEVITKQLNPPAIEEDEPRFNKKQIQRMLKKNELLFFFDGYDEIIPAHREAVTKILKEFIELYPQHSYIITSRPESGLLAFPAFKQYSIKPLNPDESYELIRKYDSGGGRAEQLISILQKSEMRPVREFLKNPLLCSLLYRSFEYKQSVPLKKHVFYRQVYDALYDWHDASKDGYNTREKRSGLDIDAFHRMLRVVGFYSVMKGNVEGDRDTVLGWIRKAKAVCRFNNLSESNFLEDLVRSVPLFVKDGDLYRWSHKSISEYFAAQYICTEGKADQQRTLETIMESSEFMRFTNMLDQIYDVDNNGFMSYLVLPAAKAFKEHWEKSYRQIDASISEGEKALRRAVTFDRTTIVLDKFELASLSEFRSQLQKIKGITLPAEIDTSMLAINIADYGPIVTIQGRHCLILQILASKRDPLVLRRELIEKVNSPRSFRSKSPVMLTDDPTLIFNLPDHFAKLTRILIESLSILNAESFLKFDRDFKGMNQLTSLTDELLDDLKQ